MPFVFMVDKNWGRLLLLVTQIQHDSGSLVLCWPVPAGVYLPAHTVCLWAGGASIVLPPQRWVEHPDHVGSWCSSDGKRSSSPKDSLKRRTLRNMKVLCFPIMCFLNFLVRISLFAQSFLSEWFRWDTDGDQIKKESGVLYSCLHHTSYLCTYAIQRNWCFVKVLQIKCWVFNLVCRFPSSYPEFGNS